MTNEELLLATARALDAAHHAPFAEWSMDHRGHSAIVNHTRAWADRGNEWAALAAEVDRRGLPQPAALSSTERDK